MCDIILRNKERAEKLNKYVVAASMEEAPEIVGKQCGERQWSRKNMEFVKETFGKISCRVGLLLKGLKEIRIEKWMH